MNQSSKIKGIFVSILLLFFLSAKAQTEYYRRHVSLIQVSQAWMPNANLKNSPNSQSFSLPQSQIRFMVPILQKKQDHNTTAIPSYIRLHLNGGLLFSPLSLSLLSQKHYFFQPSLGLTGMWYKGNRNLFLATANAMISEDNFTLLQLQLRGRGSILFRRLPAPKGTFSYMAGIGFSYIFGTGRFFPVLGIRGAMNKSRTLRYDILFPTHAQVIFSPQNTQQYGAFLRLNGNAYRFGNKDSLSALPSISIFRNREIQLGLSANFFLSPQIHLQVEGGGLFLRRIGFSEQSKSLTGKANYYISANPKIAPFAKLTLGVYIQKRKYNEDNQQDYL